MLLSLSNKHGLNVFCPCMKAANAEDLFGDADDISSVSSHGGEERAEADMVCAFAFSELTFKSL